MQDDISTRKIKWLEWLLRIIPIASAIIAIVSLLLTLAARKKELTFTYLGASKLVSIDPGGIHPDIRMDFRGVPITSLYKLSFRMKNTGAAAIKREDIRDPIGLRFPVGTKLLSSTVEHTRPSRFPVATELSADNTTADVDFPLLNSGDEADLAIYLYNSEPVTPTLDGRIVDVKQTMVSDTQDGAATHVSILRNTAVRRVLDWFLVLLYLALSGLCLYGAGAAAVGYLKFRGWRRKWGSRYDSAVADWNKQQDEKQRQREAFEAKLLLDPERSKRLGDRGESVVDEDEVAQRLRRERERAIAISFRLDPSRDFLKEKGIQPSPNGIADTFGSFIGLTLLLLSLSATLAVTAYLCHLELRF